MVDAVVEVHDLLQAGLRRLRLGVDPVVAFVKSEMWQRMVKLKWSGKNVVERVRCIIKSKCDKENGKS